MLGCDYMGQVKGGHVADLFNAFADESTWRMRFLRHVQKWEWKNDDDNSDKFKLVIDHLFNAPVRQTLGH